MEQLIPRHFLHCCREKYLMKFGSPCLTQPPKGYTVRYTYPNGKHESVGVEGVKRDELIVSSSPKYDSSCKVTVEVCTYQGSKSTVVAKFNIELLSLSDYLFQKIFFPSKDKQFSEVVDPKIASSLLAMFLAFYCNLDKDVNKEQQIDGILQTLISQSKDHKGNLASITTASYGTQENIIHFALRNRLNKTACYLIRNLRGYDHLYLEQDKNCKTPLDLAKEAGYHDLAEDITEKAAVEVKDFPGGKRPLGKTNSNLYVAVPSTPADDYVFQSCKPISKAIVRERFKHPRITELLEVGDSVDIIDGPTNGYYYVCFKGCYCYMPEVILLKVDTTIQNDTVHNYEDIDYTQLQRDQTVGEDLYTSVTAEQVQTNITTPASPTAASIAERQPMAPPREKKKKSATTPRSSSTSSASTASTSSASTAQLSTKKNEKSVSHPKRPPLPSFSIPSRQKSQSLRTPPRKSKSVSHVEAIYDTPIIKSPPLSISQVDEPEECYVEPFIPPSTSGPESDTKEKPVTDSSAANTNSPTTEKSKSTKEKPITNSTTASDSSATTEKNKTSLEKTLTNNSTTSSSSLTNEKTSEEKAVTNNVAAATEKKNAPVKNKVTNLNETKSEETKSTQNSSPARISSVDVAPPSHNTEAIDNISQQTTTNGGTNSTSTARSVSAAKKFFEAKSPPPGSKPTAPKKPVLHKKLATTSATTSTTTSTTNAAGTTANSQLANNSSNTECQDGTNDSQSASNKEKTPEKDQGKE
ncbi:uncharacterized protein [Dysidea avara]|uniref:uncharacterized protein n=1 Tax=Dysidea avara TaxID=196820 RepID=UPI0033225771